MQRGLQYLVCPSVRLCACVSVYLYSQTTGNEVAHEQYTHLQCNKCSKNNVANLAKTAAFWQEKLAPLWTTFHDPAHQLAQCVCVLIARLGACLTGSVPGAAHPGVLRCCKCYFWYHWPVSELLYPLPGYVYI